MTDPLADFAFDVPACSAEISVLGWDFACTRPEAHDGPHVAHGRPYLVAPQVAPQVVEVPALFRWDDGGSPEPLFLPPATRN